MAPAWVRLIWNSFGVAILVAAAQLGVAQALGIIRWTDDFQTDATSAGWQALLTWVAFVFVVAVIGGAAVGRRAMRRPTRKEGIAARLVAALFAALGAAVGAGLAWLPARSARSPFDVAPGLVVAMTAAAAIIAAAVLAFIALSVPPIAGSIRASVAWVWLVAIVCSVAGLFSHQAFTSPRVGVVDAPSIIPVRTWSGPDLMIAVAGLLSLAIALLARPGGANRFGIAVSGLFGPGVIAVAYLIAGPGPGAHQHSPYRAALIAVMTGFVVSTVVALPGRRGEEPRPATQPATARHYQYPDYAQNPDYAQYSEYPQYPGYAEYPGAASTPASGPGLAGRARHQDPGQPPISFDEDYSDWLKDLGHRNADLGQQRG